jgi:DNA-binding response OmpR family regulator
MPIAGDFTGLAGKNVLVVEDDYFMADEMAEAVRRAGGIALGPVPEVEGAMAIIASTKVDAAVLDIRLGDELSFPLAQALREKGIPVVFVTGYDDWFLPNGLDDVPVYRKPADPDNVVRLLFEPRRRTD